MRDTDTSASRRTRPNATQPRTSTGPQLAMADDFRLQDECQQLQDPSTYTFAGEQDVSNMDGNEVNALLEGACQRQLIKEFDLI